MARMRSKRLSYIPTFEPEKDLLSEARDQAMEIDEYYDELVTRDNTENEGEDGEIGADQGEQVYHDVESDGEEDTVFPLISEPLKTFVTVNPATLEDEELWPLSSLRGLCEYVGISVKGNRRCILNRLQAWNGAPLSGAGHPDSYDTRSARFHTVPMAFLERNRGSDSEEGGGAGEEGSLDEAVGRSVARGGACEELEEGEGGSGLGLRSFHSPCIKKMGSLTSTPVVSCRRGEIKSCLNTMSTPRKRSAQTASKSAGRICFSPYNHVRVFVSNPGERELNMDPYSIFRLVDHYDDYEYDDYELEDGETLQTEAAGSEGGGSQAKDVRLVVGRGEGTGEENSNSSNFWSSSGSVFASGEGEEQQ